MARKPKPLTKDRLAAIVSTQIEDADLFDGSDREGVREWALRFFEGEVDIPSMGEGRSSVVSRDVADTHGIILPGLMRTFFATDRVVVYEPTKTIHEDYADLATDYVNYVVMRECNGYREFRNAFWDGLLLGNGIVKFWWDDTPEYDVSEWTGVDDEQYALILDGLDDDDEILEHREYPAEEGEGQEEAEGFDTDADDSDDVEADDDSQDLVDDGEFVEVEDVRGETDDGDEGSGAPMPPMPPAAGMEAPPAPAPAPMGMGAPQDPMAALAAAMGGMGGMPMLAPPPPPMLHDLKVRRIVKSGTLRIKCIPGEEVLLDRYATEIDDAIRFIAHKYEATRSQLIEDGHDPSVVNDLPTHHDIDDAEDTVRDRFRWVVDKAPDKSTELVEVFECYILVDADGDGIAERRRVVMAGSEGARKMLSDEAWSDDVPFADIVPDPRPHTWRGRGLYESIGDMQRIKTVGWRGVLDNLYSILAPAVEVEENAYVNMDAVYDRKFNDVLIRRPGKQPLTPVNSEFIAPNVIPLLEQLDMIIEKRTGVSVRSKSQNADVLQNQSATAATIAQSAMHAKVDEYAQNIAHCGGMGRIFKCILKLFIAHQDKARKLRISGEEVTIDPRMWDAGMDVSINTGLGTGNRDRDVQALQVVLGEMKGIIQQFGDPFNPFVNLGHLFDAERKLAEAVGLKNADAYFPVVTQEQVQQIAQQRAQGQQNQPNPAMMQAQAQMQVEQMKAQARMALDQQKAQFDAQMGMAKAQSDAQLEREREAAKLEFQAQMNQMQMMLKQQMQDAEIRMMEREAVLRADLQRREMELEAMLTQEANVMKNARVVPNPVADTNIRGA